MKLTKLDEFVQTPSWSSIAYNESLSNENGSNLLSRNKATLEIQSFNYFATNEQTIMNLKTNDNNCDISNNLFSSAPVSSSIGIPHKRGSLQLWQFLLNLLVNPKHNETIIEWTRKCAAEFKLLDPEEVARQWGIQKNRPTMNYDKLSRSLRYYYEKGIMQKVSGERYVYRFINYRDLYALNPELVDLTKISLNDIQHLVNPVNSNNKACDFKSKLTNSLNETSPTAINIGNNNSHIKSNQINKIKLKTTEKYQLISSKNQRYSPYIQKTKISSKHQSINKFVSYPYPSSNINALQSQFDHLFDNQPLENSLSKKVDIKLPNHSISANQQDLLNYSPTINEKPSVISSNLSQFQTVPISASPKHSVFNASKNCHQITNDITASTPNLPHIPNIDYSFNQNNKNYISNNDSFQNLQYQNYFDNYQNVSNSNLYLSSSSSNSSSNSSPYYNYTPILSPSPYYQVKNQYDVNNQTDNMNLLVLNQTNFDQSNQFYSPVSSLSNQSRLSKQFYNYHQTSFTNYNNNENYELKQQSSLAYNKTTFCNSDSPNYAPTKSNICSPFLSPTSTQVSFSNQHYPNYSNNSNYSNELPSVSVTDFY